MDATSLVGPSYTLLLFKTMHVTLSPETATHAPWRNIYQTPYFKEYLVLVAVDEAHCDNLPCRGSDFRTSGGLRALAGVPFMALSASAPPPVAEAIEESLVLKSPVHIKMAHAPVFVASS